VIVSGIRGAWTNLGCIALRAKHSCVGATGQQERQHSHVTVASGVVKRSLAVLIDKVDVAADVLACGT
jgi:hypothetical protein